MFGKLLKYDFRSMWKQFSILWPAVLVLALINRFTLFTQVEGLGWTPVFSGALEGITLSVFVGLIFAMFVVSMVYVINRFYRGLLGDEGYLMHTLPVKTWQLVASKLVCAVCVTLVNLLVMGLAMFLLFPLEWSDVFDPVLWRNLFRGLFQDGSVILYLAEFFLLMVVGMAYATTTIYLAMSIGHLFARRRVLMSVAAYFGLSILVSQLGGWIGDLGFFRFFENLEGHAALWSAIGAMVIPTALFFFGASYILKTRLNLE